MGYICVNESPLRFEETKLVGGKWIATGVEIPVRYYTDLTTQAIVAFIIDDDAVNIVKMRLSPGKANEPMVDKVALKSVLGTDDMRKPSAKLTAQDLSRIDSASSLTPKEVK